MRRRSTGISILIGLMFAWSMALPRAALADLWYEHYDAAEKALADENWATAIEELTSALEKKGDSAARARTYGMKFRSYFPYLKLGIAYYELGQLDAALQAFETEEQLGAISQSQESSAELERYRRLAEARRAASVDQEAARIRRVVEESMASFTRLEEAGDLEGAIAALGQALAVSPENADAAAALDRLRSQLAERQQRQDALDRASVLVSRGRELLTAGSFSEASSVLSQALAIDDDPSTRALLAEAQLRLREQLAADEQSRSLTRALTEAEELLAAGRLDDALERLQPVLAVDPQNPAARALERRLLGRQEEATEERVRVETVRKLLGDAKSALSAARFEQALTAANLVLAVDSGNETALDYLAQAYRAINGRLLGVSPRQNFPPAVRFADRRLQLEDGTVAEFVKHAPFLLTGVVIDDSEVDIEFFTPDDRPLEGSATTQALGDLFITEFQLAFDLEPGQNTIRLVATDARSVSSSAEYEVFYIRPFFRAPWFYALLTALVAAGAGAVVLVRSRRRRRLRRRRFNPYMAGAPVLDDRLFFGREQLLDRILQTLHNNSLLLHGERRIGKTTLQHQLKKRLEALEDPTYDFFPVYIDLQGTREEQFFATLAAEIFEGLGPVLNGLEPRTALGSGYTYRDLVADLRAVLKTLRRQTAKDVRLVLLIDEVDELNAYDPKVNQKLRSLFMKSFAENLVAVVSGVAIKREWDREGSPWYNFFEEVDVGPFEAEHARALVESPIRGVFQLEDGVVERIVELTCGRPYRIQRLCMKLVSRAYDLSQRTITVADVEAIGDPDSRGASS